MEPAITAPSGLSGGRPATDEKQLWQWLDDMRPFLRQGCSLSYSMDKAGLMSHKNVIYRNYAQNQEFREEIDRLQSLISDLNNSVVFKTIENLHARMIESTKIVPTSEEVRVMDLIASKHRTSQPFWVSRTETAEAKDKDFGKVVNESPQIQYVVPAGENNDTPPAPPVDASNTNPTNPIPADTPPAPSVA